MCLKKYTVWLEDLSVEAITRPRRHRDTFVTATARKLTTLLHPQRVWMVILQCAVPDSAGFWSLKEILNMSEANGSQLTQLSRQ